MSVGAIRNPFRVNSWAEFSASLRRLRQKAEGAVFSTCAERAKGIRRCARHGDSLEGDQSADRTSSPAPLPLSQKVCLADRGDPPLAPLRKQAGRGKSSGLLPGVHSLLARYGGVDRSQLRPDPMSRRHHRLRPWTPARASFCNGFECEANLSLRRNVRASSAFPSVPGVPQGSETSGWSGGRRKRGYSGRRRRRGSRRP